jgi:hypothetical protein
MFKKDTSFQNALENVNLTPLQRSILEKRYMELVRQFAKRCFIISIFFHTSRAFVTVGSLVVPALLSIQYTEAAPASQSTYSMSYQIYWITWAISLLVTTFNGIQNIFKFEKKYYFLHTTMEQLRSEGWQYIELSGKYSGFYTPNEAPSHENQFVYFCASVEKIKMHQVEEEYWKINESQQDAQKNGSGKKDALIPPTPFKPLQTSIDIHPETLVKLTEMSSEEKNSSSENKDESDEQKQQTSKKSVPVSIILSETTDAR